VPSWWSTVTTITTLHAGHDVAYLTAGQRAGGCAGAMSYYTVSGEPPGQWAGKGAAALGLTGQVDPSVIARLYQHNIGPGGELLVKRRQSRAADEREKSAVAAYWAAHPYASAVEVAEVRAAEHGTDPHQVPYFDLTVDVVKSVSVLHASYRVAARQARERGDPAQAAALDARADQIEAALLDAAREAVGWLERRATYTRTGHHSTRTGEWRDGDGLVASVFLHHISRDGDPHLHVHVAVWNRVQRADQADEKWRTLDSRSLHNQRLAVAPVTDRIVETRLSALGYAMVPREDGNGAEVGGVSQDVMDLFSSRSRALTPELKALIGQYQKTHGKAPSKRTIWLLGQQAAQNTRRTKAQARCTVAGQASTAEPTQAQRLAAWEAQTARREVQELSAVHEQVARFGARHAGGAPTVLDDAAKRRAARIAVAEVQQHHAIWSMAQLRFEVHRALPVLSPCTDGEALVTEVATLAVSGRAGTEVVEVTAPDIADVTGLGVRVSDGGSIYRPPNEERYCTLAHLDTEQQILTAAKRAVPQLVTGEQARAAAERTGLTAGQRDAMITMLTATTATTALVAAAGAGKTHTMAEFARLWTTFTGRRVIGLATATNAARVLASEGLAESYNIAEFLGKIEGSEELRRPVPLHQDDVLVLDEASQLSTTDLAMVQEAARATGARLVLAGDTEQLGAVEAGGMFRLLAQEVPYAELHEVRRFDAAWEAGASVRLRAGDFTAYAAYDRHGKIRGADQEAAMDRAASMWLADHLRGKNVLLLAGSNSEAAELSRRVQAKLIQLGTVEQPQAKLSDGNQAGTGDLIRARLNTTINAGGRELANRDTLKITGWHGPDAQVRRRDLDGTWTSPFLVPRAYLADSAELDYAGNIHVGQGRTVDTAHLLVTGTLSRRSLYVGLTRGRESNTAHIVTGKTAPPGHPPYEQASPESVVKAIMDRDDADLSATEQIRQAQDWTGGTGHLLTLWSAAVRQSLYPQIDDQIKARLTGSEAWRYEREHSRQVLQQGLRAAQLAGHDINSIIDQITAAPMDRARSISSVLHGRLRQLPDLGHGVIWAQRTPKDAPAVAHELAAGLDQRARALGERLAVSPEPWLANRLGVLAPHASPVLREDYARRAATAAAYREAAGITDPGQAIAPKPHRGNPELDHLRRAAIRALELRDQTEILRRMTHGELEARILHGDRALASAPPDVSRELRLSAQAETDAWQQSADADIRRDSAESACAKALARQMAARREELEAANAHYEKWAADTSARRGAAGEAKAELERRGLTQRAAGEQRKAGPEDKPQTMAGWWRQFEADFAAVDRAIEREHQAALVAGKPWPPEHKPQPEPASEAEPAASPPRTAEPENWSEPPVSSPGAASDYEPDGPAARLDKLLAQASQAAQRVAAENAGRQARAEYAVRVELELRPEPERALQAESPDEAEIEL
jgi:conjugative relaxase-like TrwC/TraI family protein